MSRLKLTLLLLIIYTTISAQAQKPGTTLNQQYQDVIVRSGSYQGFKQIRKDKLELFWKNITDTLAKEKALLNEAKAKMGGSEDLVSQSKTELELVQKQLDESKASVNQVSLLGIPLEKGTYSMLMWGIVLTLAAALAFALYRNKAANSEARYRTELYHELTEEYQKHKVSANDKEKKLARSCRRKGI